MPGDYRCESCVYYDYDDECGEDICTLSIDEDELAEFMQRRSKACRYYRYYDEYKVVEKQN